MTKKIHFITQAKGGSGKSVLAFMLAEKYRDAVILDLDDATTTSMKQFAYRNPVKDFRGAMGGRADKGIIITTGRFSKEAQNEAIRDGVPPIELMDGEKLIDMFERYKLGLRPKTVYEIVPEFFDEFK